MVDFNNILQYRVERPETWTVFGSPEDFDNIPIEHKDQIVFLNNEAEKLVLEFLAASQITNKVNNNEFDGKTWIPFAKNYFKTIEEFAGIDDEKALKKWLYEREIPFKTFVFIVPIYGGAPVMCATWKMVVKYAASLCFANDVIVFDKTLNWCLYYFHEEYFFFGKDNIYNPEEGYKKMRFINEMKRKNSHLNRVS